MRRPLCAERLVLEFSWRGILDRQPRAAHVHEMPDHTRMTQQRADHATADVVPHVPARRPGLTRHRTSRTPPSCAPSPPGAPDRALDMRMTYAVLMAARTGQTSLRPWRADRLACVLCKGVVMAGTGITLVR